MPRGHSGRCLLSQQKRVGGAAPLGHHRSALRSMSNQTGAFMNHEFESPNHFLGDIHTLWFRIGTLRRPVAQLRARVLMVDDEPENLLLLEEFLADTATDVYSITDPREVEQAFKDFQPDIVLLDLHMPGIDGREILRRLRGARDSLGFLPVVVLTGDTSRAARNSAFLLGANDFLTN